MLSLRLLAVSVLLAHLPAAAAPTGYLTPRPARDIAASPWGIQAGDDERLDLLDRAGALGVKWTRLMVNWSHVETQRGSYDFTDADAMVDAALRAGVQPFLCLTGGNKLYSEPLPHPDPNWRLIYGVKPAPPILDEKATAAWLAFVDATLAHFRARVGHWEIWNEPNHYAYWGAKPSPADYGRLVRVTAERIRAAQPKARIIAGSLAGIDAAFIAGFLAEDTGRLVDVVSFHNYANLPEARIYLADDTWAALNAHKPGLELWQGECGYGSTSSTKDFRGTSPWGEIVQAKWLLRQALIDTFYMRTTLSNYFKLFDGGDRAAKQARPELKPVDLILGFPAEPTGRRVRGVGVNEKCLLANPDLTPKPGYYAYQNLISAFGSGYQAVPVAERPVVTVLEDGQFQGIKLDDAYPSVPLTAAYQRTDGSTLVAWWLPWQPQEYTPRPARVTLRVKSAHYREPVLVNPLDGSVHAVAGTREGADTVFASVPLFDFPLLIAERATLLVQDQPATLANEAVPAITADAGSAPREDSAQRWARFQPEFDAFTAADRAHPARTGEILLVGSSVFRRWKNAAEQLAPLPILNRAFGGSRTSDQVARFDQLVPMYRPAVIAYYCGSNDLKAGQSPEEIFARYREFSDRVARVLPETHLVFVSSTRSPDRADKFAAVDRYNALVRDHCAFTARRHFVDVNPALVDPNGRPLPGVYGKDDLHPEAPGYDAIASVLKPALAAVWHEAAGH